MADLGEPQSSPELTAEAATPAEAAPAHDLSSLLAEFEASTAPKPAEPATAPQVNEAPQPPANPLDPQMAEFQQWSKQHLLEQQVKGLTAEVGAARTYIDRQHFSDAVESISRRLSNFGLVVPEGYVKTALMAAAHDPNVAQAFDNRGADPRTYARVMRKLQDKIIADAKMIPDREVTGDVAAVIAAMRGATSKERAERPPDYGAMTDAEFNKELVKHNL